MVDTTISPAAATRPPYLAAAAATGFIPATTSFAPFFAEARNDFFVLFAGAVGLDAVGGLVGAVGFSRLGSALGGFPVADVTYFSASAPVTSTVAFDG